jgi:uroporphyrinogen decarboxylase
MKGIIINRDRDFREFMKVLRRKEKPAYLPFYEHVASLAFISSRMETDVSKLKGKAYWQCYVDFWLSMGFDCIPMEIPLNVKLPPPRNPVQKKGAMSHGSEAGACIFSLEDMQKVKWPPEDAPIDFTPFEIVAEMLPRGVKIVGGVRGGPFEFATQALLGVEGLAFALVDQPELVESIFNILNTLYTSAVRKLAEMDAIGACRQGDDLGFKTSTFLPPALLRKYIFPIYKNMVEASHLHNKPFILHSCGNLKEVYEDIIQCGFDAKHSFEDTIMPVRDFKQKYGARITPLGGLDVDVICRYGERELREYTRRCIAECFYDGYWALGTGNSLTPYMPVENYLCVLDEGVKFINSA